MSEAEFICKHCGSDDIAAEVEARGWARGWVAESDGKPYFEQDGVEYDDVEEIGYSCGGCQKRAWKIEDLVTPRVVEGQLLRPCGRCDHDVRDHPLASVAHPSHFIRGPMPCMAEGCDCHDYYDLAVANAGITLEVAA